MNGLDALLPKNKFDSSGIDALKELSTAQIAPLLPALLTWIQDCNWPVSADVLPVLALHQAALVPLVLDRLRPEEDDDIWKYWIITRLLPLFAEEQLMPVLPSVKRIAQRPTPNEISEEVAQAAADFLAG